MKTAAKIISYPTYFNTQSTKSLTDLFIYLTRRARKHTNNYLANYVRRYFKKFINFSNKTK